MPAALWRRLGMATERELAEKLTTLIQVDRLSGAEAARRLGAHQDTLYKLCVKLGVPMIPRGEMTHRTRCAGIGGPPLSQRELEVLDGLMLGDGHIDLGDGGWAARYTHGERHPETLKSIAEALPSLSFSTPWTDGTYHFFKSRQCEQLVPVWRRWYGTGTQQIPRDLVLTREVVYWFFLGDGYLCRGEYYVGLATHGFSDESRRILRRQFSKLGMDTRARANGSMYVCARSVPKFYALLGPCRNPEYTRKWDYVAPRYTYVRRHKSDIERDAREAAEDRALEELECSQKL